jgi:hypothetical protein
MTLRVCPKKGFKTFLSSPRTAMNRGSQRSMKVIVAIPAKAGIRGYIPDPGLSRSDGCTAFSDNL